MPKHLFLGIVLLLGLVSNAQISAPKYSNEFLAIGVGARALAMSGSVVSSNQDLTAGYWNPAGLTGIAQDMQVGYMHADYFAGIAKFDYAGIAKRMDDESAASLSIMRFGVDDIPNTLDLLDAEGNIDYDRISVFSASDYAFVFSYARNLPVEGLTLGGSAKVIYRQVGSFAQAWGFGLDAGLRYKWRNWDLGLMARDITSTWNAWSFSFEEDELQTLLVTDNILPENSIELTLPRLIFAVSRKWEFQNISVLAEGNLDVTTDGRRNVLVSANPFSIDPHMGVEIGYRNRLFLRGGAGSLQQVYAGVGEEQNWTFQPSAGVGLALKGLKLDYALTNLGFAGGSNYTNIFSVRFDIVKRGES